MSNVIEHIPENSESLTPQQQEDLSALLAAPSVAKAAEALGIHESTLYRRLREPALATQLRQARHEMLRRGIHLLQQAAEIGARTLQEVMLDADASPTARVSAARAAISLAFDGLTIDTLEQRVEELEAAARHIQETSW